MSEEVKHAISQIDVEASALISNTPTLSLTERLKHGVFCAIHRVPFHWAVQTDESRACSHVHGCARYPSAKRESHCGGYNVLLHLPVSVRLVCALMAYNATYITPVLAGRTISIQAQSVGVPDMRFQWSASTVPPAQGLARAN